jgi:hypothetical protein
MKLAVAADETVQRVTSRWIGAAPACAAKAPAVRSSSTVNPRRAKLANKARVVVLMIVPFLTYSQSDTGE